MLTRHLPRSLALLAMALLITGCEKVPLLAPTGSTITLTAATNALSANGGADIIAYVLESSGVPPHSGTEVTFTTTLGTLQPSTVRTDVSGRVTVRFSAGASNGTATITASSGGATTGPTGAIRIAIGTAAVGRVSLSANPTTISANGGVAVLLANVVDINGNPLTAVPVSFSTTAGTLGGTLVTSDVNGNAQTTLTTSVQATVTATVGAQTVTPPTTGTTPPTGGTTTGQATATVTVNVNPLPIVSVSVATGGTLTALTPVTFTIGVAVGTNSTAQIRSVTISFGDGSTVDLGAVTGTALSVQHLYDSPNTYTVRVTALDTLGASTTAATTVVIQAQAPTVTINASPNGGSPTNIFTFTAQVFPTNTTVVSYSWNFGDGTTATTTLNQTSHPYVAGSSAKTVSVTVTTPSGQQASTSITINP